MHFLIGWVHFLELEFRTLPVIVAVSARRRLGRRRYSLRVDVIVSVGFILVIVAVAHHNSRGFLKTMGFKFLSSVRFIICFFISRTMINLL